MFVYGGKFSCCRRSERASGANQSELQKKQQRKDDDMDEEGSVGCSVIHAHGSERTMMMMLLVGWWVVGSVYLSSAIHPATH